MAGIYLHIPFCKRRCVYCGFYSTTRDELRGDYIGALCRELRMRKDELNGEAVKTLYIGGGTPSQLQEEDLKRLFDCLTEAYGLTACEEITMEVNPDDLTEAYVSMLRRFPINRLSMGIQTFDDKTLELLRRRHTAQQAKEAVRRCREAGFTNLSIDLMYGLPGQTLEQWEEDLRQAVDLGVEHLSAYSLMYEEGTTLWNMREEHAVEEADEELSLRCYQRLVDRLEEAGYEHYEISNFARPGYASRHNSCYWDGTHYLGCGAAAHSYDGKRRQWNVSSLTEYIRSIQDGKIPAEAEELDLYTRYNDRIVTALRTRKGISLKALHEEFGERLYRYCLQSAFPAIESKLLKIEEDTLRLTREGIFLSDGIMSDLLWVDEEI